MLGVKEMEWAGSEGLGQDNSSAFQYVPSDTSFANAAIVWEALNG